jgi:hypothetical protein
LARQSEKAEIQLTKDLTYAGRACITFEGDLGQLKKKSPSLDVNQILISEALPLINEKLSSGETPLERISSGAKQIAQTSGSLLLRGKRLFNQLEKGQLKVSVKYSEAARAVRKLKFGVKSSNAAIMFASFFLPGVFFASDGNYLAGIPLIAISIPFLFRYYRTERRMDDND